MDENKLEKETTVNNENDTASVETKKPVSNMIKLGVPLVIVIALLGVAFTSGLFSTNKAANMLALAYVKNMDVKKVDASVDLTMEALVDSDDASAIQAVDMINNLNIKGEIKADLSSIDSFAILESLKYNYDETEMFSFNVFMNNNTIAANVPGLLDEYVYADFDKAFKLFSDGIGKEFQGSISDYYKLFTTEDIDGFDKISLDYGTFIMKNLNDKISFGEKSTITTKGENPADYLCDQIIISLTGQEYVDLYIALVNKVVEDTRFEKIIKAKIDAAIEISKANGALEMLEINDDEITAFNETFSTSYAKAIEEIKNEIASDEFKEKFTTSIDSENEFKFIFFLDEEKNIRAIQENLIAVSKVPNSDGTEENMTIKLNMNFVYNEFDNVVVDMPNLDAGYDITVEPQMTMTTLFMQVQSKLGSYLEERPALQEIFNNPGMMY